MENLMSNLGGQAGLVPLVQACRLLKLTYQQAYARVLSGRLPAERVDGRWYLSTSDLRTLLGEQQAEPHG